MPVSAPEPVRDAILAANRIVARPYRYGGGHGAFSGYDCSGAVSYALHGAGLLAQPRDSSGLTRFGAAGAGRWMTIYADAGRAYVVVAGLRLDMSGSGGQARAGSRRPVRPTAARHRSGL